MHGRRETPPTRKAPRSAAAKVCGEPSGQVDTSVEWQLLLVIRPGSPVIQHPHTEISRSPPSPGPYHLDNEVVMRYSQVAPPLGRGPPSAWGARAVLSV